MVVLALPLKFTTEPLINPVPLTVSVNAPEPAVVPIGSRVVITGTGLSEVAPTVPLRATCWVVPATLSALSVNVSVPVVTPPVVGENTTPITQESPAARAEEVEQVVVPESTLKFAVGVMALKFRGAVPMLATLNVSTALLEPKAVCGKVIGAVANETFRTRLLGKSAIYRLPGPSTARFSALTSALVAPHPSPSESVCSVQPVPPPATVVMMPVAASTFRILPPPEPEPTI